MSHGGAQPGLLDFSANVAPLGAHPAVQSALAALALDTDSLARYPDSSCAALRSLIAQFWSAGARSFATLDADCVVCGAGAVDVLYALVRSSSRAHQKIVVVEPAFSEYARAGELHGHAVEHFLGAPEHGFALVPADLPRLAPLLDGADMLFLASPANPAGTLTDLDTIRALAALCAQKSVVLVLDACFAPFSAAAEDGIRALLSCRHEFPTLVVVGAFTKFYGMAGIRLGYALCCSAAVARRLSDSLRPWAVGAVAQAAGCAVMRAELAEKRSAAGQCEPSSWETQVRGVVAAGRARMADFLRSCGCRVVAGAANYILFRADDTSLAQSLLRRGIAIRSCADFFALDAHWYRIAVRTEAENARLVAALSACLGTAAPPVRKMPRDLPQAANIMIQGTMSNAGKSVLVAALCRIFAQDGYRVAPFKSQNMALNSGVTADGLEMGRAQIMQAAAAGIAADVRMNPILLKPTGETGSQVVVNGVPIGTMGARDYFARRTSFVPQIMAAYRSLAAENDIIVLEGAGSPAEINLRDGDIVNMGLADLTDAPVLIAGDIDRGGVFAALYGTAALVTARDRKRIKGFVINKFRGDVSLLRGGVDDLRALTGIPVLGVVPFLPDLLIDDEDSLCGTESGGGDGKKNAVLHVGVVRLPYLSNATDLLPFARLPSVRVTFFDTAASCAAAAGGLDLLVLPGTKNAVRAMDWLRDTGLDAVVVRAAAEGVPVVGICGGFQLLGNALHDPDGNEDESARPSLAALGLLPVQTTFTPQKTRVRVSAELPVLGGVFSALSGRAVEGYEIHHGQTAFLDGSACPRAVARGNVLGTYVHGFFDGDAVFRAVLTVLCARRGIPVPSCRPYQSEREAAFDRLAAAVRSALDMDAVYRIVFGAGRS